jgi:hypothetical protein
MEQAMMMIEGKLRWSRNPDTKNWYVWSHDDQILYVATAFGGKGGWEVTVTELDSTAPRHRGPSHVLGTHRTLQEAKRAVDRHHHEHIRQVGPEPLYQYTLRYPVGEIEEAVR